ncbi:MAG: NfeD family protein [Pseudomonadota bacterium]
MDDIAFWHWLILGVVLMIVEILVPGLFFAGMGTAALLVGGVAWLFPALGWQYQVMAFAVLSIVSIAVLRQYLRTHPIRSDQPALNRRGEQYVGRVFVLTVPIQNGIGKVHVDDSTWKAMGADAPAGTKVRVVAVDGTVFRVEAVAADGARIRQND